MPILALVKKTQIVSSKLSPNNQSHRSVIRPTQDLLITVYPILLDEPNIYFVMGRSLSLT